MRDRGEAPTDDRSPFDLRMTMDDRTYDGTDLRDGSELPPEHWDDREPDGGRAKGLPRWNPKRANRAVTEQSPVEPRVSPTASPKVPLSSAPATPSEGTVVPIRSDRSSDGGFSLPAWAEGASVYKPLLSGSVPVRDGEANVSSCTNCGGAGRIEHLDLLDDTARLECMTCGFRWIEAASSLTRR